MATSQVNKEWLRRYNGMGNSFDAGETIGLDNFNNIIIGGNTYNSSHSDFMVAKYSSEGQLLWMRFYDDVGEHDYLHAMAIDKFGNIYVTGGSSTGGENFDYCTIKFSPSGDLNWVSRYNGTDNGLDIAFGIALDSSGNVYVTGQSDGLGSAADCVTIKYNSSGQMIWLKRFTNANHNDEGNSISVDLNHNVYVSGSSVNSPNYDDYLILKYDSSGVQEWMSRYDGTAHYRDFGRHSIIDDSGNVYVTGYTTNLVTGIDITTIKYNTKGVLMWVQTYNGFNGSDIGRDITSDRNRNIYIMGSSVGQGTGYDYVIIKYNMNGEPQWNLRYNDGLNDFPKSISTDKFNNIYIFGYGDGNQTGNDFVTIMVDSGGVLKWSKRYDYSGSYGDESSVGIVDNLANVYVTGQSNRDMLTIKYSQLTGINIPFNNIRIEFGLQQNYPNPFNPETVINYYLKVMGRAQLIVFDVLGNEVATLVNETKPSGSYEIEFDGSDHPSGIYFYRLEVDGNHIDTKRMILLK